MTTIINMKLAKKPQDKDEASTIVSKFQQKEPTVPKMKMSEVFERIDSVITDRKNQIDAANNAIDANNNAINEANQAAEIALAAGDENAYVVAKQKAAEAAARVEFNTKRRNALQARPARPDTPEIRRAALAAGVAEYKVHAARVLELMNELIKESDAAGAAVERYNAARNKWCSYVDNSEIWPDFPNRFAVGFSDQLSFSRDGLSNYLETK